MFNLKKKEKNREVIKRYEGFLRHDSVTEANIIPQPGSAVSTRNQAQANRNSDNGSMILVLDNYFSN